MKDVKDLDPRMEDEEIIRIAVSENRMVVTMDKDLGELVYHFSMRNCGFSGILWKNTRLR